MMWLACGACTVSPASGGLDAALDVRKVVLPSLDGPSGDLSSPGADAGIAPAPIACPPTSSSYFVPQTYVPATAHLGACSPSDIADFLAQCIDPGSTCGAWFAANVPGKADGGTPCGACIDNPNNSGGLWTDPLEQFGPNYGGCIQLKDPVHGAACASALNNATGCEAVACEPCPDFNPNDYYVCVAAADATECSAYAPVESTACAVDGADGGALATCSPDNGGTGDYAYIIALICGSAAPDASAAGSHDAQPDAPVDAPADASLDAGSRDAAVD